MDIDVPTASTSAAVSATPEASRPDVSASRAVDGNMSNGTSSKKSKKRKRQSEAAVGDSQATANGTDARGNGIPNALQAADLSGLTQAAASSPAKKKKRRTRSEANEASQMSTNGDLSQILPPEEAPVAGSEAAKDADAEQRRKERKAEKKRKKREAAAKRAAQEAATAAATRNAAASANEDDLAGDSDDIPVPQLANGGDVFMDDAEAALAAANAPAASASQPKRTEGVGKKQKPAKRADKKGKGKAKEPSPVPLFQPDEEDDEEKDELADDDDDDGIPELPPPLSSRRAVNFIDVGEEDEEEKEEEASENEAIDPVLRASTKKQKIANNKSAKSRTADTGRTLRQRKPTQAESASGTPSSSAKSANKKATAPMSSNSSAGAGLVASATGVRLDTIDGIKPLGPSSNTPENQELLASKLM